MVSVERWKVQWRRRRNALLPLHALPLDIFHQILEHSLLGSAYSRNYYVSLWRLRSVSVYWMRSIDGLPSVWTSISSSNTPRMVTVALNNSLDLHLDIEFTCRQAKWSREHLLFASKITPHSRRWRSLTIVTDEAPDLSGILSLPAPNLRNLWISCTTESGCGGNLLSGDTLGIRNLYLRRCFLPWDTTYFEDLHSLVLSMGIGGAPVMSRLLTILGSSPNLQRLELDSSDMLTDLPGPPVIPIFLTKLSRMRISIPEEAAAILLQSVVAPQVRLHVEVHIRLPIESTPILPHVMQFTELSTLPRSICPEIDIVFGEAHLLLEFGPVSIRVERDFWYNWDPGMPERMDVLRALFQSLSPTTRYGPTRLRFTPDDDSEYQHSYHVLRNLVNVVDAWFPAVTKFTVEATMLDDNTAGTKIKDALAPTTGPMGQLLWPLPKMAALTVEIDTGTHDALAEAVIERSLMSGHGTKDDPVHVNRLSISQGTISRESMKRLHELTELHTKLYWVEVVDPPGSRKEESGSSDQSDTVVSVPPEPAPSWIDQQDDNVLQSIFPA